VANNGTYNPLCVEPTTGTSSKSSHRSENNPSNDHIPNNNDLKSFHSLEDSYDKWDCKTCTYKNNFNSHLCEICYADRDKFGSWQCKSCRKINNFCGSNRCGTCKSENKSIVNSINNAHTGGKGETTPQYLGGEQQTYDINKEREIPSHIDYPNKDTFKKKSDATEEINGRFVEDNGKTCTSLKSNHRSESNFCRDNNENDMEPFNSLRDNSDKWHCRACTNNNPFSLLTCKACDKHRDIHGSWLCSTCTYINTVFNMTCSVCKFENKTFADCINNSYKGNTGKVDFKKAGGQQNKVDKNRTEKNPNPYDAKKNNIKVIKDFCNKWEILAEQVETSPVMETKPTKPIGNNQKINNEAKSNNNSRNIQKTAPNQKLEIWICWNNNCKQQNQPDSTYCKHCHLSRYGSYKFTQYRTKDQYIEIWVCYKCNKYNKLQNIQCESRSCDMKKCDNNQSGKVTDNPVTMV